MPVYTSVRITRRGVQHETIGYLRELVKRGGIIREREKLWPRKDR